MIICLPHHPNYLSKDPESISRTFLEQFALVQLLGDVCGVLFQLLGDVCGLPFSNT